MIEFPVYVVSSVKELPKEGIYYIVGKDGLYLKKDTGLIEALVKVKQISLLKEVTPFATLKVPKIPVLLMAQVVCFFRAVYRRYKAEAIVLLYYSAEKNDFMVEAVKQVVAGAGLQYKIKSNLSKGYKLMGTIHSHANFEAFHSDIDRHDEANFDGLHITVGNVNKRDFTLSSTIVVNDNRFKIKSQTVIEGIEEKKISRPPFSFQEQTDVYYLVVPGQGDYQKTTFPEKWLDKVKDQTEVRMKKHMKKLRQGTKNRNILPTLEKQNTKTAEDNI